MAVLQSSREAIEVTAIDSWGGGGGSAVLLLKQLDEQLFAYQSRDMGQLIRMAIGDLRIR
jgi:hypothetical protein